MHKALSRTGIGLCAVLSIGCETVFAGDCKVADYGAMPVEVQDGRATTVAKINGQDTRFILDTGAFFNTMSLANAEAMRLRREPAPEGFFITGVGGSSTIEETHVREFGILGATLHNVEFVVGGSDAGMGLLGANLLDAADLDIDLAQGKLHMMKPSDCGKRPMAYWAQDGNYQEAELRRLDNPHDRKSYLSVDINGKSVWAMLDTGAEATILTRRAAVRAGIDLSSPAAKAGYTSSGIGGKNFIKTWTVPIDSLAVGTETIQHTRVQVLDGDMGDDPSAPEMLLGLDFFLSHHLFIANSQNKIYFTYNGGRVFALGKPPKAGGESAAESAADPAAPSTAEDYALRGQARLSLGESAAAVADLDNAIRMAPDKAPYYLARARANLEIHQPDAAKADLDKSIELDPRNVGALLLRAKQRINDKDNPGAESDIAAARQLAPPGSEESQTVADFYIAVGQPTAAIPLFDDWIRLHGKDSKLGIALNNRCWARGLANQEPDAALADCQAAIRRDGPLPSYLDSLGLIQMRRKKYPEAIDAYAQAVTKNPRSASSRYGLGLAKIRGGQPDAGAADLEAAKALDPKIEERFTKLGV